MNIDTPIKLTQPEALAKRYGAGATPAAGPWNDVIDLILSHRSIRNYRPDPLPDGMLETLIAAAQSASTGSNLQAWSVVAVTDPAIRKELAAVGHDQQQLIEAPVLLIWLADLSRHRRVGDEAGADFEVIDYLETFLCAVIDATLAAQTTAIAAESLGLSCVYAGSMRNDPQRVAKALQLPPAVFGVVGLCVGYADPDATNDVKPRLPQELVLHRDTYKIADEKALQARYDAEMRDFSVRNGMKPDTWTDRVRRRMGSLKSMHGRDRMVEILHQMGFKLR